MALRRFFLLLLTALCLWLLRWLLTGAHVQPVVYEFALVVPTFDDLHFLLPLACRLKSQNFVIFGLVYDDTTSLGSSLVSDCFVSIHLVKNHTAEGRLDLLRRDLRVVLRKANVVIIPQGFPLLLQSRLSNQVVIAIPRTEFQYTQWMAALTRQEWLSNVAAAVSRSPLLILFSDWNFPHVTISVITQNRPQSLNRLLTSLSRSLFFGDNISLKINLEQSSDGQTMRLVDSFVWNYGTISIHHRIIHGGLLPAVVESWYPHANHSYALILEDDVEVSPLFYAWIKMAILRYRYGDEKNISPQLFGISLYQQKSLELPIDGRRSFDAQALFRQHHLEPSIPYLSPIPCSWGAVYFPNHWREFHDYIIIRLSEVAFNVDQDIVPNVRSNHWTKSWKKYFIELAFLRGYVMLYPNFSNYTSLSTNHLELGSHVKSRTKEKQNLFELPLMKLPKLVSDDTGIFNLPNNTLPCFHCLPAINLTGSITYLTTLKNTGALRRLELLNCTKEHALLFNAQSLMCIT